MLAFFGVPGPIELIVIGLMLAVPILIVVLATNRKKDGPVERNMIACPDCGRMNSASDKFCSQCGKQFGSPEA